MDKVRFGIVGFGNMGTGHFKNFLDGKIDNGIVTAICDVNPEKFSLFNDGNAEMRHAYPLNNGKAQTRILRIW